MDNNSEVVYLYLDDIIPNRFQPREIFDDQALKELAVSIKEHGVIQPIIVRKVENKYEIIAGERRYKASTMAGLTKIPAIVKNLDDKESSKVALIENLQRRDLSPIEEARTYQKILELEDNMTQEELAATMGKTQSSVSNKLRLLELPEEIQDALLKEKISERHARSLLTIEDKNDQIKMMDKVITEKMTVRELEKEIKSLKGEGEENNTNQGISLNIEPVSTPTPPVDTQPPVSETAPQVEVKNDTIELPKPDLDSFLSPEPQADLGETNSFKSSTSEIEGENRFDSIFSDNTKESESDGNSGVTLYTSVFSPNLNENKYSSTGVISTSAATETKDVSKAISDLKNSIDGLKSEGYKITFNEEDGANDYKISIQIDKN